MKITNVSIRKSDREDSRMKAIASVLLDDEFAVHDIAHPISQEVRTMFEKEILDAYEKALNEPGE